MPTAGGVVFGGYAICGDHGCPNILVRSDLPPSLDREPYTPEYLGWVTLHELGHALGLGHATNLLESTDLMGYGWPDLGDPVLSDCDLDALAFVFAWALEGAEPTRPAKAPTTARSTDAGARPGLRPGRGGWRPGGGGRGWPRSCGPRGRTPGPRGRGRCWPRRRR